MRSPSMQPLRHRPAGAKQKKRPRRIYNFLSTVRFTAAITSATCGNAAFSSGSEYGYRVRVSLLSPTRRKGKRTMGTSAPVTRSKGASR